MPGLTREQTAAFLDESGHLMRLGTNGADGMPRVIPLWFVHEEGALWFTPRARSAWLASLRLDASVVATSHHSTPRTPAVVRPFWA